MILLPTPNSRGKQSREAGRSTSTNSSLLTQTPQNGVVDLSLVDICSHIDDHPSLRATEIISSECYSELAKGVMHRFILLELCRPRRKTVWVRLDRRPEESMSFMRLLAMSKVTKPNDRVRCSDLGGDTVHPYQLMAFFFCRQCYQPTKIRWSAKPFARIDGCSRFLRRWQNLHAFSASSRRRSYSLVFGQYVCSSTSVRMELYLTYYFFRRTVGSFAHSSSSISKALRPDGSQLECRNLQI